MNERDQYFDERAKRFAEHIYGTAKGAIRLAVLQADLSHSLPPQPLRILDIGAGLGQMSLWLAAKGHQLTLAEPSNTMLEGARSAFAEANLSATFLALPWQQLEHHLSQPYDLVLCHGLLEWLAEPMAILPTLRRLTRTHGWLSLAFYNKDALIYRNLLKGHFRKIRSDQLSGHKNSLTPPNPLDPQALRRQLQPDWVVELASGIRIFHDYMPIDFQQRTDSQELLQMELNYRQHPSFAGLGRYLHWLCRAGTGA